jgi:hypothetical protein
LVEPDLDVVGELSWCEPAPDVVVALPWGDAARVVVVALPWGDAARVVDVELAVPDEHAERTTPAINRTRAPRRTYPTPLSL